MAQTLCLGHQTPYTPRMDYVGVNHVAIAVEDFDTAVRTYRDLLGFEVTHQEELPDRGLKVAFVDAKNTRFEILGAVREDSEISRFLHKRGGGLHHVCMEVPDIEAAIKELQERGAQLIDTQPQPGAHNTRVAFLHPKGTHGVLIEIAQIPKAPVKKSPAHGP